MSKKKLSDKEQKRRAAQQKRDAKHTPPQPFQPKKKAWKR